MYRDPGFQEPFSTMDSRQLLALGRLCGRRSLQAKWAFLAILPVIAVKEAHRREGFTSIFGYAAMKGGVDYREVKEVLNLYDSLGRYWCLWRLLAMGAVGMSKLQRIRRWVSPENAAWWAEQLVNCTRAQLDALIEAMRARETHPVMVPPGEANPGGTASPECPEPESSAIESLATGLSLPSTGEMPSDAPVFIRLQLSPFHAKALRELQGLVERAEGPTALGDLVGRLVVVALARQSVPARRPPRSETGDIPASAPAKTPSPPQTALPPIRMLRVAYRNLDTGAEWLPGPAGPISLASIPPSERERIAAAPETQFAELRARALAAKVRHARSVASRRIALGPTQKGTVDAATIAAGEAHRRIPVAIEVYLMARSGGLCEISGCRGQAEHFHHGDPYSEHHTHDPDRMLALCKACHDAYHSGLLVPDKVDPRVWRPVDTSDPVERNRIDEAVLAAKARFREAS